MAVAHVRIGELEFHGGDLPSSTGFTISSLDGWKSSPGVRRDSVARPSGHGSFVTPGFASDRAVTLRGRYWGQSVDEVLHNGDVLSGLGGTGEKLTATVQWDQTLTAAVYVQRARFDPAPGLNYADYQLELWMPDPFKYGAVRTTVNSGTTFTNSFHYGNAPAVPRFTVTGNMTSGYSLVGKGGRVFSVPQSLPTGQTATIDFRTGVVRHDGVRVASVTPSTWSVNGGETVGWQLVPVTGSGTATCFLTDTFI